MHPQQSAEFLSTIKQDSYVSPNIAKFPECNQEAIRTLIDYEVKLKPLAPVKPDRNIKSASDYEADAIRSHFNCGPIKSAESNVGVLREWEPGKALAAETGRVISVLEVNRAQGGHELLNKMKTGFPTCRARYTFGDCEYLIFDNQNFGRIELPGIRYFDDADFVFIPSDEKCTTLSDSFTWTENQEPRFTSALSDGTSFVRELLSMQYALVSKQRILNSNSRRVLPGVPDDRVKKRAERLLSRSNWLAQLSVTDFDAELDKMAFHYGFHFDDYLELRDLAFDYLVTIANHLGVKGKPGGETVRERIRMKYDLGATWRSQQDALSRERQFKAWKMQNPPVAQDVKAKPVKKKSAGK
jgi:hypothetical protein